jgi:hypothetical protein
MLYFSAPILGTVRNSVAEGVGGWRFPRDFRQIPAQVSRSPMGYRRDGECSGIECPAHQPQAGRSDIRVVFKARPNRFLFVQNPVEIKVMGSESDPPGLRDHQAL